MLSLFPQILFLAPMGTALLRIAAGLTLLWLAYFHSTRRRELAQIRFPLVGRGAWLVWVAVMFETAVGAALVVGYLTQLVALLCALFMLKHLFWQRRYPQFFPLSRAAAALLLVICIALLLSGAGAFAFDLPL